MTNEKRCPDCITSPVAVPARFGGTLSWMWTQRWTPAKTPRAHKGRARHRASDCADADIMRGQWLHITRTMNNSFFSIKYAGVMCFTRGVWTEHMAGSPPCFIRVYGNILDPHTSEQHLAFTSSNTAKVIQRQSTFSLPFLRGNVIKCGIILLSS